MPSGISGSSLQGDLTRICVLCSLLERHARSLLRVGVDGSVVESCRLAEARRAFPGQGRR